MNKTDGTRPIGLIGLGTMGHPIATRLMDAGFKLAVNDVNSVAGRALAERGAQVVNQAADLAALCDIVFLSLPGPAEVEDVLCGKAGLLDRLRKGAIVADLSTNSFGTVRKMHALAIQKGVSFVDAPLSGGAAGAIAGTLSALIGGDAASVATLTPYLKAFCANIFHVGEVGLGTVTKLVNNQILLTCAIAVQEGLAVATKAGIADDVILDILSKSSSKVYMGMAPRFLARDYDNVSFKLAIASKDVDVALASAREFGLDLPTATAASEVYHKAIEAGLGSKVFYATLSMIDGSHRRQ